MRKLGIAGIILAMIMGMAVASLLQSCSYYTSQTIEPGMYYIEKSYEVYK